MRAGYYWRCAAGHACTLAIVAVLGSTRAMAQEAIQQYAGLYPETPAPAAPSLPLRTSGGTASFRMFRAITLGEASLQDTARAESEGLRVDARRTVESRRHSLVVGSATQIAPGSRRDPFSLSSQRLDSSFRGSLTQRTDVVFTQHLTYSARRATSPLDTNVLTADDDPVMTADEVAVTRATFAMGGNASMLRHASRLTDVTMSSAFDTVASSGSRVSSYRGGMVLRRSLGRLVVARVGYESVWTTTSRDRDDIGSATGTTHTHKGDLGIEYRPRFSRDTTIRAGLQPTAYPGSFSFAGDISVAQRLRADSRIGIAFQRGTSFLQDAGRPAQTDTFTARAESRPVDRLELVTAVFSSASSSVPGMARSRNVGALARMQLRMTPRAWAYAEYSRDLFTPAHATASTGGYDRRVVRLGVRLDVE